MTGSVKVGPVSAADNTSTSFRGTKQGALVTSSTYGKYYDLASRGLMFSAANVTAQATSVGLTTTYTGLCIYNPASSGKNLVMLGYQYAIQVGEVAIAPQFLIAGFSAAGVVTHTAALAAPGIMNCLINGTNGSAAGADTQATIVNPFYLMPVRSGFTAGALGGPGMASIIDLEGRYVIPPGGWIANGSYTATTGLAGFTWTEVAV